MTTINVQLQFDEISGRSLLDAINKGDISNLQNVTFDKPPGMILNFSQQQRFKDALAKALLAIADKSDESERELEAKKITFYFKLAAKNQNITLRQYLEQNFPVLTGFADLIEHGYVTSYPNVDSFVSGHLDVNAKGFWSQVNYTWDKHNAG